MTILSKRNLSALIAGSALIGSFALAGTAFAAGHGPGGFGHDMRPAVVGTVASVSGNTLTVTAKSWRRGNTATTPATYTVDATNATVTKGGAASTVSTIAVGDTVVVSGTTSGANITATAIRDGMMGRLGKGQLSGQEPDTGIASRTPAIMGNGEPVIGGKVTAISGATLTVTNSSNVTYTVDATSAKIVKAGVTGAAVSSIIVDDSVVVQGTVNGTSVTAASVIDRGTLPSSSATGSAPAHRGFFAHLFGF